jgi:hypothetical protein
MKSGNPKFLASSGPLQACNGTALPFYGLITGPEESYRLWRVFCDQETSKNEKVKARYRAVENTKIMGCNARKTTNNSNNSDALLKQGDATVIFCISPAENVWRIKIDDRKITNNELKDVEYRSLMAFWKKS